MARIAEENGGRGSPAKPGGTTTMHFPVYLRLFGLRIHPHPLFEGLAYFLGFQLYLLLRRREKRLGRESLDTETSLRLVLGCAIGAFVGSKVLGIVENVPLLLGSRLPMASWLAPKTIVGGLLGGWAGIEIAKNILGLRRRVGDLVLFPVILGMAIGRIGCFLTGLDDGTCGSPSRLPWAVNFGDGVPRHPTQLYDIVFLLLLGGALGYLLRRRVFSRSPGLAFRIFLLAYCAYRFAVEFIKPTAKPYLGLSAIQLTCLSAMVFISPGIVKMVKESAGDQAGVTDGRSTVSVL
ncbi:MAG TPA: prolipoprotein diacylglyceryl transferase family protein [Tepidisphaeraceae bacterium]|nr:prolipoprotein diacylglyceryl transferase family protein [Tepidisphaeraceae bacterium]